MDPNPTTPKAMADLQDELNSKLHGDAPTLEQLRDLPMLDDVINESLRIFPPVPTAGNSARPACRPAA